MSIKEGTLGVILEHWVRKVNKRAKKVFEERSLNGVFHPEFVARYIAAHEEMDENKQFTLSVWLQLIQESLPYLAEEEREKLAEAIRPQIPFVLAHVALKNSYGQQG